MMRFAIALVVATVACGETVKVPLDLGTSDPSCQGAEFSGQCAASVLVELDQPEVDPQSQCVALADALASIDDLPAALSDISFPALADGDTVTISVSVFDQEDCNGNAFVTGTSQASTLDSQLETIRVNLTCTEVTCEGDGDEPFAVRVVEIFGDGDADGLTVSVGFSTNDYSRDRSLTAQGGGRYIGNRGSDNGCLSASVENTFESLDLVSCLTATGQHADGDHFAYAASSTRIQDALDEGGLAAGRTVLGRVETENGSPVGGAFVDVDGDEVTVLYFNSETDTFETAESTFNNGVFAIGSLPDGCCTTVSVNNSASVQVNVLNNGIAAARLVTDENGGN